MRACEIAVIGAGPYGLAAAAHLHARGAEARVFGRAMEFWQGMPSQMLLRSAWEASHIPDPEGVLRLDDYAARSADPLPRPVPLERYVEYGRWFQREAVPDLDTRSVASVEPTGAGFRLRLDDGEIVPARRVAVAAGIAGFARRPAGLDALPRELVSHVSEHAGFEGFAGRRVLVVGSGQSALESAALLHESGAMVEVVARAPRFHWLRGGRLRKWLGPLSRLLYPSTDVGPPGINWIVAFPDLFRQLPGALQERLARRAIRPAGAGWLVPRLADVRLTAGRTLVHAVATSGGLSVSLDDGSVREADHLLLATGYRVDITRYPFLPPALLRAISSANGYPRLGPGLESSVPGLHFLGAPAAASFGPLMRFVSGAGYAARAVAEHHCRARASGRRSAVSVEAPVPEMAARL
jgi:FAD-dependent urate hydroxylase